jgi:hypothetical protein
MRRATWLAAVAPLFCVAGCITDSTSGSPAPQPTPAPTPTVAYLSPTDHLVRASMALRGMRPSLDELRRVNADPTQLPAIIDGYLASTDFGEAVRDLYNEALDVRVGAAIFPAGYPSIGTLAGTDTQAINVSVTQAPLRLVEYVVENDRPLTEMVTADYTMADGNVAKVWGLAYDGSGPDWRVTHWTDGRPPAGILDDSWLFTAHATTYSNSNRGRANEISRSLLCFDFLSREIVVDASINLADPQQVAHAVQTNDACASCHHELDPLAAYFGPFFPIYVPADLKTYPFANFNTALAPIFTVTPPAYFGHQATGLDQLGQMIAQDPRFSLCAAERFYAYFNDTTLDAVPEAQAAALQSALVASGMNAKALAKAVVLADDFRVTTPLTNDATNDPNGVRMARPWQLAHLVQDLTGFVWQTDLPISIDNHGVIGAVDLMRDSLFGFEVLAGGIDSVNVTLPSHTMNASAMLVLRSLAAKAAPYVVGADLALADPTQRRLLTRVAVTDTGEDAIRAQLVDLELRLYGQFVDAQSADVTDAWTLFSSALAASGGDVRHAWTTTLFAMLQDVRIAYE